MPSRFLQIVFATGIVLILILVLDFNKTFISSPSATAVATTSQTASVVVSGSVEATTSVPLATSSAFVKASKNRTKTTLIASSTSPTSTSTSNQVRRIVDPYSTPPVSIEAVNDMARSALVNIICTNRGGGSFHPISGSGVIIDPRGVILTNAHVAQYVLLSESLRIDLSCVIRSGAPAQAHWFADVLYIPPIWVGAHSGEINTDKPTGTGEHDYALLRIVGSIDGSQLPAAFPYLSPDVRDGIGFLDDSVLAASYPAEFLGGIQAENNLYSATSVTTIKQLLTFATTSIDLVSIGGIIEAQSGSSGGAVVNAWNRLIGIITTTSEGTTTAARDLRAITLSYIDRDLEAQTGVSLESMLQGDLTAKVDAFKDTALSLIQMYLKDIPVHSQ